MMQMVGLEPEVNPILRVDFDWVHFRWSDLTGLMDTFPPMLLGGLVLGSFAGVLVVAIYKYLAKRAKAGYAFEKELEDPRSSEQNKTKKEEESEEA